MSAASASTTHLVPTDSFISLSSTAPVIESAPSATVSSSVFESVGSQPSQAIFTSSDTLTPHTLTAVPTKSDVLSGSIPFTPTFASSHELSAVIIDSSPIKEPSDLFTFGTLSSTSPPASSHTASVSAAAQTTTPDSTSSNNEATSHTTSSDTSSMTQTSTVAFTPSTDSAVTSVLSSHYIHSYTIQETGEDTTPTTTSPYTDSTPNTSGQEKHNSAFPNAEASTQSPISGVVTDTSSGSFWSVQETPIQRPSDHPSDIITSPPTMNTPSSPTEHSNYGLTSLSPISVNLSTATYQGGTSTVLESEISTSTPFVRLRNTVQDGSYTTYATTFTSLKTLFTVATITASPTPTVVITTAPYLTETEVITTTFVARDSADFVTATIIVPASKAGSVFRLSKAQIGGITAGAVGLFAFLAAIVIYLILRKRRRNFVLVPQNKIRSPESNAEIGEHGGSHNIRQSIVQVPASTSGGNPVILPPSGSICRDAPRVSSSSSTISYQHPSHTGAIDPTNDLTAAYVRTSSADINSHSDEGHSEESSSYLTAQTVSTESLASELPHLAVDPLSRRMSQSSRIAYEKEIEALRQEILSQADRITYLDEQIEFMHPGSPPPPSYRSSRRSAISTQTSRSTLSLPPPLPSREISH